MHTSYGDIDTARSHCKSVRSISLLHLEAEDHNSIPCRKAVGMIFRVPHLKLHLLRKRTVKRIFDCQTGIVLQ
jgi:hypothetical protein